MATTIKTQETAGGAACGKTGTLAHCQWEWKNGAAAVKSVAVTQKLKIELTRDPAVPFLCIPRRTESTFSKRLSLYPCSWPHRLYSHAEEAIQGSINK